MARDLPDANALPTLDMRPTGAVTQIQIADPTERIAQNTMRAAGDMQQFAGVIEKAKNEFDQTVALDAYGKAQDAAIQMEAGYKQVRGKDAATPEFYKKVSEGWGQKMGAIAESLNPEQQRLFQRQAQPLAMTFKAALISHINEQGRVYKISTNKGIIDQGLQLANGLTSTDDIATGQAIGTLNTARQSFDNLVTLGAIGSREEAKAAWQDYLDKFHSNRVLTVANDSTLGGPVRAEALLKDIQKQNIKDMGISAHAYQTLSSSLRTRVDDQLTRSEATAAVTSMRVDQEKKNDNDPDVVAGTKAKYTDISAMWASVDERALSAAKKHGREGDATFVAQIKSHMKSEISDINTEQTLRERQNWRTITPMLYPTQGNGPISMTDLKTRLVTALKGDEAKANDILASFSPEARHSMVVAFAANEKENGRDAYNALLGPLRNATTGRVLVGSREAATAVWRRSGLLPQVEKLTPTQREELWGHVDSMVRSGDDVGAKATVASAFDLINQGRITEQWQLDRYGLHNLGGFANYSNLVRHLEEVRTGGNVQNRVAIERSVREATTAWNSLSRTSGFGTELVPAAITDYRNEVIDRLAKVPAGNPEQRAKAEKSIIDEVTKPDFYNRFRPDVIEMERRNNEQITNALSGHENAPVLRSKDPVEINRLIDQLKPGQSAVIWFPKDKKKPQGAGQYDVFTMPGPAKPMRLTGRWTIEGPLHPND